MGYNGDVMGNTIANKKRYLGVGLKTPFFMVI